ncbi:MAG TPA: DUF1559 domain-containing protein [Planctomycetia bacterium]|nr:DUF1559 domain-containing protein [Planctomycetia bacterium]
MNAGRTTRLRTRCGVTLLELLVVIGVIGILLALLLPAIQAAREAARAATCRNNLHQLGIAVSSFETSARVFPSANGFPSLHGRLLPYLERAELADGYNAQLSVLSPANTTIAQVQFAGFLCPSDSAGAQFEPGSANYVGSYSLGPEERLIRGPFAYLPPKPKRAAEVLRGLSKTAAFSETLLGDFTWRPLRVVWRVRPSYSDSQSLAAACDSFEAVPGAEGVPGIRGREWASSLVSSGLYNHCLPPNSKNCSNDGNTVLAVFGATSDHASSVNVLYLDGSVQTVSNSIELAMWRRMGDTQGVDR